jgi:ABC-type phosphonate transport system ATPase subunit
MARSLGAIAVQNISKSYGIEAILKDISFTLNPGDRLGAVSERQEDDAAARLTGQKRG